MSRTETAQFMEQSTKARQVVCSSPGHVIFFRRNIRMVVSCGSIGNKVRESLRYNTCLRNGNTEVKQGLAKHLRND